jgi:hypothetical protein
MPRPPLEGVRILAVSPFGAGPFGTQHLAGRPAQRESAVTKLFVAEAVGRIVEHAMQGLGEVLIAREALKEMDE